MKKKILFLIALVFLFGTKVSALTYINRIDINYDTTKVRISPAYTYSEVKSQFRNAWVIPDGVNYGKGNSNIWMDFCPTSERCTDNFTGGYNQNILPDRYTWVDFEVFANPYKMDAEDPEYDFDKDHLDDIEIYVNGVKREDAIIADYNSSWREVDVFIPVTVDTTPFVESVEVKSEYSSVAKGETALFTADVNYYGNGYDAVNWTVSNNTSEGTTINSSGVLTVAGDEEADELTITATSTKDGSKTSSKNVVVMEMLVVDTITVRGNDTVVIPGSSVWFYSTVTGTAPHNVTWSVSGNNDEGTHITDEGNLLVAATETSKSLVVTATSAYDKDKKANINVTVNATKTFINKIEINYDTKEAYLTTKTTYNKARSKFENAWTIKEGSHYSKGNNNIYFYYCPTTEECSFAETTHGYGENVLDRFTWTNFEVYAEPFGMDSTNPIYDFDKDHLDQIEVWVNGVKRTDATVQGYNSSWRAVDVFFPVPVSTEKLTQELRFTYDAYTSYYEADNFTNYLYHSVGDGEVTYSSSDPEIAIVDPVTGSVKPNDVGEVTIYATAAETEDYKAKTISYKFIITRRDIYPTVTVEDQTYTGSELKPEVVVKHDDKVLVKGVDYKVTYENNINVGTATVTVESLDTSKYIFEREKTFSINKKELTSENVIVPEIIAYDNGNPLSPNVTVRDNGKTLVKDTDYTVSYSNQLASINSHVYVYVYGAGNYKGTITKEVLIEDPALMELEVPVIKIEKGANNSLVLNVENNAISATYEIYRSTNKKTYTKIAETDEISYTDSNLTYGTTYYYKVIAKNNYDKTDYSNLVSMKVVPDKVKELDALTISTNQVKLGWTKQEVTGYEIYRSLYSNKKFTKVATTKNVDNYTNTRLSANKTYYYKVRAFKTVGRTKVYGDYSDVLVVKTAPVAPKVSLKVEDYDTIAIIMNSVKGASKYEIYRSLTKNGEYTKIADLPSAGNYKDSSLTSGQAYYYKVRACNENCGNYSAVVTKTPIPKTPGITLSITDAKRVKVAITEVNGATGYEIYRSVYRNRKFTLVGTTESLEYIDEVALNRRYYYKVRAYRTVDDKKVYGAYSSLKYASVGLATPTITVSKNSFEEAKITINGVQGAAGYEIYRSLYKNRKFTIVKDTTELENLDGLTLNSTYYYKVRAYILANGKKYYSKYSKLRSIKLTLGTPTFATERSALNKVNVNITAVENAEGYEIYRSLYKNRKFALVKDTTELTYEDLINLNTTYYYKVRAYIVRGGKKYYSGYTALKTVKIGLGIPTYNLEGQEGQVEVKINEVQYAGGYEVYRAKSKYGKFTKVGEILELSYNDPGEFNKTYYYKVRAYATINEKRVYGGYSIVKSAKVLPLPLPE